MSALIRTLFLLLLLSSFPIFAQNDCAHNTSPINAENTWHWQKVEVIYLEQEGGFYGFQTADQQHYLPLNLDELYQQPGLKLRVLIEMLPHYKSFRTWGTAVHIHYILASCS